MGEHHIEERDYSFRPLADMHIAEITFGGMQMNKLEMHSDICEKLGEIYAKKSSDYGDSFGETYRKLGIISAVTRINDKVNRLTSLCTKPADERKVLDESIEDTLLDTANYCIMTVMEMRRKNQ